MSIPVHRAELLTRIDIEAIPQDADGHVLVDLFIELPNNARFIRFLAANSPLTESVLQKIKTLSRPYVYVNRSDLKSVDGMAASRAMQNTEQISVQAEHSVQADKASLEESTSKSSHTPAQDSPSPRITTQPKADEGSSRQSTQPKADEGSSSQSKVSKADLEIGMVMQFGKESADYLKKPIAHELSKIFNEVILPNPGQFTLEDTPIGEISTRLLEIIAPDVDNFRSHFRKIPQYLGVMDDSAAVTAIAVLYAVALGQSSRSVFRDLSYACLLMDFSLLDMSPENWHLYYNDQSQLSPEIVAKVQNHPRRSYEIVQKKFTKLSEIVGQLIIGHHELFNGRGYPRHIRSELLAPLVRMFACAIDTFEVMKRESLDLSNPSLIEVLEKFMANDGVQPHERRHSLTLIRQIHDFLTQPHEASDPGTEKTS
jgi:hypothetical protein